MKFVKFIAVAVAAAGFVSCGSGSGSSSDITPPVTPPVYEPTK